MVDISSLSNEELLALGSASSAPSRGLQSLSNEELLSLAKGRPSAPQGVWDTIKTQAGNAGQAADDIARLIANGATFGYADKLAGYMGGGLDAERAKTKAAEDRAGYAGTAAGVLGSIAPGGLIAKGVGGVAGLARSAPVVGAVAANPFAQAGVTGAVMGAADASGHDTDLATGALFGAGAGVAGQGAATVLSKALGGAAGAFNKQPKLPSVDELRAAKDAAYKAADDAGVMFTPKLMDRVRQSVQGDLANLGYLPANQPKIAAVLNELDRVGAENVTLKGVDAIRKAASGAYDPMNKSSNAMISKIIGHIDYATGAPAAGEVLGGNSAEGIKALLDARKLNSQVNKIDRVSEAMTKAERQAASTGSGGNSDNAIRQKIRAILDSPAKSRGFTADEKEAMELVVRGTPTQNTARLLGKLSPQGNGLMAALGLGATAVNPLMAAGPAVGMAAKTVADKATPRNVEKLLRVLQAGGKKSDAFAGPNAVQRLAESERDTLARALMGLGISASRGQ